MAPDNRKTPGLTIYSSDKIEDLADNLKEKLAAERKRLDPFDFSTVVVPNTNIEKWLRVVRFADEPSLCMGIEFPFIESELFRILADRLPGKERPKQHQDGDYAVGILSILLDEKLPKDDFEALAPFRRYVADGKDGPLSIDTREKARMAWQLAAKLAGLMDQYEVYRYDTIVEKWLRGRSAKGDGVPVGVEAAEAALARRLFGKDGIYPPDGAKLSLRQLFERTKKEGRRPAGDGKPIYFFGLSTLSPLQKEVLAWLAKTRAVVFYHYDVCLEFWGEIETRKELLRRLPKSADADLELKNPLLQQWGAAGRETLRLLVDIETENSESDDHFPFEWKRLGSGASAGKETMLAKVQRSIRTFAETDADEPGRVKLGEDRVKKQDASIQVVAAPGLRREVETVYNAILGAVWKPEKATGERPWSDCKFSDIAVLVPDMATYRPVIEAVFDGRGQIPYALIDTSASEESAYLQGFLGLMALARDGLSRETLFALLDNPCVQRALSFGPDDAAEWRRYADAIGAFDGFEGEGDFGNLAWDPALRRLRLGRVAEPREDGPSVWNGGDDESALKFSAIVETLHRELSGLSKKSLRCARPPSERDAPGGEKTWADELRRIANEFLAVGRDDKLEGPVKGQVFRTLSSLHAIEGRPEADAAHRHEGEPHRESLDFVVTAVEESVGGVKSAKGGYLTHGVTIAGLHPMRPVPFKQVFVLGMGEGMFPGRDPATTLDIPGAARSLGDVRPTAVKKLLFLETMMAVKERLVLSYPCLDPVRDAELFPSGMVCELEKFLSDYVLPTETVDGKERKTAFLEAKAPVLERAEADDFLHGKKEGESKKDLPEDPVGPIVWKDEWWAGLFPTYSAVERRIALGAEPERDDAAAAPGGRVAIRTDDLAEFLKSPLRAALRHLHGIAVEGYKAASADPEAPLEIPYGPVQWALDRKLFDAADAGAPDIEDVYGALAESGKLADADGFFGRYAVGALSESFAGGNAAALVELRKWADGFLPPDSEGWEKPDPVRTVLPAREASAGAKPLPERLFAAKTKDWKASGRESRALVFGKCGDEGSDEDKWTPFPPKAVLEPFVAWVAKVAGEQDDAPRTLQVGVADVEKRLHNAWEWSIAPAEARAWLDETSDAYLHFLDVPKDGTYLDFGYGELLKTFVEAKKKGTIAGKVPASADEWKKLADSFSKGWESGDKNGFDNGLVVDETVGPMGRLPGAGDDETTEGDAAIVESRYGKWFKRVFDGERK